MQSRKTNGLETTACKGIRVPKQRLRTKLTAFSALVRLRTTAADTAAAYLLCSSSSSSLEREEPREKSVLDLRRRGEMQTEKETRLAGCVRGWAEEWVNTDVSAPTIPGQSQRPLRLCCTETCHQPVWFQERLSR